jgi:hypothetical protein
LAREGATVIVSDRKLDGAEGTVKLIGGKMYQISFLNNIALSLFQTPVIALLHL